MILDATAGNRKIWINKNDENIIHIDIERGLEVKPTIFADNTQTPFQNDTFDTIFYDPPFAWNFKSMFFGFPNRTEQYKKYTTLGYRNCSTSYYGVERYKSKTALISHVFKAQKEFCRILKNDGLLWVKWNELRLKLDRVLPLFNDGWNELMRLEIKDRSQTLSETQTYWVVFTKKMMVTQLSLTVTMNDVQIVEEVNQN